LSAKEGLYAHLYLSPGTCSDATAPATVILLTGVELSWTQGNTPFHGMGSQHPASILRGCIAWEGRFKKAYIDKTYMGSFNIGTYRYCGSINPRGGTNPFILGTIVLTGGGLSNMEACSEAYVAEDEGFIIYNLTFHD